MTKCDHNCVIPVVVICRQRLVINIIKFELVCDRCNNKDTRGTNLIPLFFES